MNLTELLRKNAGKPAQELLALCVKAGHDRVNVFKSASRLRKQGYKVPYFTDAPPITDKPATDIEQAPTRKGKGIKLSELKKKYSLPAVIKTYLESLGNGEVIDEREMMEDIDIKKWPNYRSVLNSPEMEAYRGRVRNITYWGTPKTIQEGKADGTLKNLKY